MPQSSVSIADLPSRRLRARSAWQLNPPESGTLPTIRHDDQRRRAKYELAIAKTVTRCLTPSAHSIRAIRINPAAAPFATTAPKDSHHGSHHL